MAMTRDANSNETPPPPPYEEICRATNGPSRAHRHINDASLPSKWFEAAVQERVQAIFDSDPAYGSLRGSGMSPPIGGSLRRRAKADVMERWKKFNCWDPRWNGTGIPDDFWPHQPRTLQPARSPTPLFGYRGETQEDRHEDGPIASRPIEMFLADAWAMLCGRKYNDTMSPDDIMKSLFSDVATMWKSRGLEWIWPGDVPGLEWPRPRGAGRISEGQPQRRRQHREANNSAGPPLQMAHAGRGRAKRSRDRGESGDDACEQTTGKRPKLAPSRTGTSRERGTRLRRSVRQQSGRQGDSSRT